MVGELAPVWVGVLTSVAGVLTCKAGVLTHVTGVQIPVADMLTLRKGC